MEMYKQKSLLNNKYAISFLIITLHNYQVVFDNFLNEEKVINKRLPSLFFKIFLLIKLTPK